MACEHKFIIVKEIDNLKTHQFGVLIVCTEGCGTAREVWEDGIVIKLSDGQH